MILCCVTILNMANENSAGSERLDLDFMDSGLGLPINIGRIRYSKAHKPLVTHVHEGRMEFVYVVRGRQLYTIGEDAYEVNSGELFFTHENEPHSTSGFPEERSVFFYIIIDVKALAEGYVCSCTADGQALCAALAGLRQRVFKARPETKKILDGIIAAYFSDGALRSTQLRNLVSSFLLNAVESSEKHGKSRINALREVMDYIEDNIFEDITIPALAGVARLSVGNFKVSFRRQVGMPPREYVIRRKMERAKEMLAASGMSITDIAYRLSFSSSQYFATVFKRYMACSPAVYRLRQRKDKD